MRRLPAATLPNRTLAPGDTLNVDVSGAFVDPDGDALSFTAVSSVPQVVTVAVTGAFVMLAAAREGAATVRVTVTDPGGLSATQAFAVTVEIAAGVPDGGPVRSTAATAAARARRGSTKPTRRRFRWNVRTPAPRSK